MSVFPKSGWFVLPQPVKESAKRKDNAEKTEKTFCIIKIPFNINVELNSQAQTILRDQYNIKNKDCQSV